MNAHTVYLKKAMYFNPCISTDSYKTTHWKQFPPQTEYVYDYYESRGGRYKNVVPFGLSYLVQQCLPDKGTRQDVQYAREFLRQHFGALHFNSSHWMQLVEAYPDTLPLRIRAVPEGTVVPVKNILMSVENTDPRFYWLPNFCETILCHYWYTTTVATISREIKLTLKKALLDTAGSTDGLEYKLHDFGMRGATCLEAAALGGASHLVNFVGTDTLPAIDFINRYYNSGQERMWGFSVPASEHSTMTSWGKDHEADAYRNMLEQYPTGVVSVVSDSYDVFKACRDIWGGELKEAVLKRQGTLVVRPDSGPPAETLKKVLHELGEAFGWTHNKKGYRELPEQVRVLWGDGIDHAGVKKIVKTLKADKIALTNCVFGMGAGLIQKLDRDTQKMAFKCSWAQVNGEGRDVWKDPITATGKQSKRGRLKLVRDDKGKYHTVSESDPRPDEMIMVYDPEHGHVNRPEFDDIRKRAAV